MNFKEAIEKVNISRNAALLNAEVYKTRLIEENESIYILEKELRGEMLKEAKGKPNKLSQTAASLSSAYKAASADLNLLFPPPVCSICGDSGRDNGNVCICAIAEVLRSYSGDVPLKSFNDFKLELFTKNQPQAAKILKDMQLLSERFPTERIKNIIFMGASGSGKTFMAGCIINQLINKGHSVEAVSSYNLFNNHLTKYHTTFDSSKHALYSRFIDCDLLVIDDLGTESMLKNVTKEYFCSILNDRLAKGKHTLITTNLDIDDISKRYDVKISSRLFEINLSYPKIFDFNDLRQVKR